MTDYRNRIIGLEYVHSRDLESHPGNWRDHPKPQVEALQGVLAEVGIAGALLAYRSERANGKLITIDGHLRKDAAPQTWPVLVLDVTDAEADYLLATHDPLAAMAQADAAALDALLASVNSGDAAVQAMLAELTAVDVIGFGGIEGENREESVWNKMTSRADYRKFEFGEFRLLLPAAVHDRLWQDAKAVDNKAIWLERVILTGLEHVEDSTD